MYQVNIVYQVSLLKLIFEPRNNRHFLIFYVSRQLEAKTDLSLIDKIELGRLYQNYTGQNPVHVSYIRLVGLGCILLNIIIDCPF